MNELEINEYYFENWLFSIMVSLQNWLAQIYCSNKQKIYKLSELNTLNL